MMLSTAQWTARQSVGGFSVSFFWPAGHKPYLSAAPKLRKRRKKKSKNNDKVTTSPSGEEGTTLSASSITAVPPVSNGNPVANDDPPSEEVDPASPNTLSAISTTTIPAATPLSNVHPVTHCPSSAEDGGSSSAKSLPYGVTVKSSGPSKVVSAEIPIGIQITGTELNCTVGLAGAVKS